MGAVERSDSRPTGCARCGPMPGPVAIRLRANGAGAPRRRQRNDPGDCPGLPWRSSGRALSAPAGSADYVAAPNRARGTQRNDVEKSALRGSWGWARVSRPCALRRSAGEGMPPPWGREHGPAGCDRAGGRGHDGEGARRSEQAGWLGARSGRVRPSIHPSPRALRCQRSPRPRGHSRNQGCAGQHIRTHARGPLWDRDQCERAPT